ncbi:MAG: hypothetical protein M1836_008205 [Candelina mexicana]|nr:MAG: hypothetical protein M1836_008205 [Candelina mexicana]
MSDNYSLCKSGRLAGGEEWPPVALRSRAAAERALEGFDLDVRLAATQAFEEAVLAPQEQAFELVESLED